MLNGAWLRGSIGPSLLYRNGLSNRLAYTSERLLTTNSAILKGLRKAKQGESKLDPSAGFVVQHGETETSEDPTVQDLRLER